MRVLGLFTDPRQVLRILRHLSKSGAAPAGLEQVEDLREAPGPDPASVT
jgi:hypothetical protein